MILASHQESLRMSLLSRLLRARRLPSPSERYRPAAPRFQPRLVRAADLVLGQSVEIDALEPVRLVRRLPFRMSL